MAEFTLGASLSEADASAAIAQAMAAGTITAAQAGMALTAWLKASAAEKQAAARPKYTKTAKGTVYFSWGKNEPGIVRSVCLSKEGWERVAKVATEIVKEWESIPLSKTAQDPEGAAQKKAAWVAKKAARDAAQSKAA